MINSKVNWFIKFRFIFSSPLSFISVCSQKKKKKKKEKKDCFVWKPIDGESNRNHNANFSGLINHLNHIQCPKYDVIPQQ